MARWTGTTKQRGLGAAHVADKKRLLALHRDGDLCWRCGKPMYKTQALDRDHVTDRAHGGTSGPAVLAHASCNRSKGARAGNRAQPRLILAAGRDTICKACGQPYHYAARSCEICGKHYHPNGKAQRTCSRACGTQLRRSVYGPSGRRIARKPRPACETCGQPCGSQGTRFCSPACAGAARTASRKSWPASRIQHWTCRYCGEIGVAKKTGEQRKVCGARACELLRLRANNWRVRYGLTQDEADAAVLAQLRPGQQQRRHQCPACGTPAPASFRWCDQCLCASRNAKGRRCGNRASTDGQCDYHAEASAVASA